MADIADFANDLVQERLDRALAARSASKTATAAHSFMFCEVCEDPIQLARRVAIPGCTQCVACQSIDEARRARHAR
ncbi:TraR/DksA family transcriptional regulator [Pseudomonas proteolytica]|uniref:TraR/DksA family transcriptional regulator n=1 Tax=Pseudomonas proteolytica TaxID=219574 RepID=UPI0030D82D6E